MNTQVMNFVLRAPILVTAITGFSTCGFAQDTNLGKIDYQIQLRCVSWPEWQGGWTSQSRAEDKAIRPNIDCQKEWRRMKSCIGLSMEEGRLGPMVLLICQFGVSYFGRNRRMLPETAFWRLSII